MKEGGMKHLYINNEGKVHFNINGYGKLQGKTVINDGNEHVIALRHMKDELKWYLFVDGKEEAGKVIPKKAVAPSNS